MIEREIDPRLYVSDGGSREMDDGIHMIRNCVITPNVEHPDELLNDWYLEGEELHAPQAAWLIKDDKNLLFETLSFSGRELILSELDTILEGDDLDYIAISHPEGNHAGNTGAIMNKYPNAELLIPQSGSHHELFGLEIAKGKNLRYVGEGDTFDLGEHTIEFHDPDFFDHSMHIWMSDHMTNTLWVVDFLGFEHMSGECLKFADELESDVTANRIRRHQGYALGWLRFVDPKLTDQAIDMMIEKYEPNNLAPTHGSFIRDNAIEYLELAKRVIHDICDEEAPEYDIHTHQMLRFTT
jgi:flavorubredoxin